MPVKMEWEHTQMVSAMGMDWTDATTDIALLDLPTLEFTTDSDPFFASYGLFESPTGDMAKEQIISQDVMWGGTSGTDAPPQKLPINSCKVTKSVTVVKQPALQQQLQQIKQETKIPAGRSLLRNFNNINNNNNNSITSKQMVVARNVVTEKNNGTATRPDTPLSLDDELPEFKHQIDLAGTIAGTMNSQFSNGRKISISANNNDETHIITLLKEHLEDNDDKNGQILEILSNSFEQTGNVLDFLKYLSDYEEDDSAVEMDSDSDEYTSSSSGYNGFNSNSSVMKSNDKYSSFMNNSSSTSSNSNAQLSHVPVPYDYQETHFGDHSYTRPKDRFDTRDLGVQTPSDSGKYPLLFLQTFLRTLKHSIYIIYHQEPQFFLINIA